MFSPPKTPQQNGVFETENRTIQDMVYVILNAKNMVDNWWAETANTTVHIINRVFLRPMINKIAYQIKKERKPKLNYLYVLGSKCYILSDRKHLGKFDARDDKEYLWDIL